MPPLILASSSPYRQQLLARLGVSFDCHSPNIDETPLINESAAELVTRLGLLKANAVSSTHCNHLIIASDQAASLNGQILGKPNHHDVALKQLQACSGQKVTFHTSLCLLNSATGNYQLDTERFTVHFRDLSPEQIERYISTEQPYDCAGSFKMEGLGICLFKKMLGNDPNSLIGLPLIMLTDMLKNEGIELPL